MHTRTRTIYGANRGARQGWGRYAWFTRIALALGMAVPVTAAEEEAARFERPGLVADRETQTVRFAAETTAVQALEPMEFFLVHRHSGHDYEAFAVTDVLPSDIHRALRHIGMAPGRGVDYDRLRFWPSGPRVTVRVEQFVPGAADETAVYFAEDTVLDMSTGRSLPRSGFSFVGSLWLREIAGGEEDGYAADLLEPHAIVTFFNLPATVLDVPRRAAQGEVYDTQVRHPDRSVPEGTPITVVLEPAPVPHPNGFRLEMRLAAVAREDGVVFRLETKDGVVMGSGTGAELAAWVEARSQEGRELWCSLVMDASLSLPRLVSVAEGWDALVEEQGLRIEPPGPGVLYYRSFLPNPAFRSRETRPAQPWELHLSRGASGWAGRMVRHVRDYRASLDTGERVFSETIEKEVANPAVFREVLDRDPSDLAVALVFAPRDITLQELNPWVRPALSTHPVIFVFSDTP